MIKACCSSKFPRVCKLLRFVGFASLWASYLMRRLDGFLRKEFIMALQFVVNNNVSRAQRPRSHLAALPDNVMSGAATCGTHTTIVFCSGIVP